MALRARPSNCITHVQQHCPRSIRFNSPTFHNWEFMYNHFGCWCGDALFLWLATGNKTFGTTVNVGDNSGSGGVSAAMTQTNTTAGVYVYDPERSPVKITKPTINNKKKASEFVRRSRRCARVCMLQQTAGNITSGLSLGGRGGNMGILVVDATLHYCRSYCHKR